MAPRFMKAIAFVAVGVLASVVACGPPEAAPPTGTEGGAPVETDGNFTRRIYERNFVFASLDGDSLFIVPWMMQIVESPDTVRRDAHAWLARGGVWEAFYTERWWTRPTRAPGQVLPHGRMRLLVDDGDAIDGILFDDGVRRLDLILGEVEASWTDPRGGSFEVLRGAAYLADQRVEGMILDMARASAGDAPPGGDWAFLLSGDSAHFVFAADTEYGGETEPIYRGWASLGDDALQWAEVRVDWSRTEAFPPARRDIPVAWRVWTADGLLEAQFEAISAEIRPGQGPGPLLPVRALYEVEGNVSTAEGTFPVRGILVHERR